VHVVTVCLQVIRARVPLIAFVEAHSGVAVDISVDNHSGTFKCIFTRELTQFDARFVTLYRLVSQWMQLTQKQQQ
jgi:DNA polymerase sigma